MPTGILSSDGSQLLIRRDGNEWVKMICDICKKSDFQTLDYLYEHYSLIHPHIYTDNEDVFTRCAKRLNVDELSQVVACSAAPVQNEGSNRRAKRSTGLVLREIEGLVNLQASLIQPYTQVRSVVLVDILD